MHKICFTNAHKLFHKYNFIISLFNNKSTSFLQKLKVSDKCKNSHDLNVFNL